MLRQCTICNSPFQTKTSRKSICSEACRLESGRRRNRKWARNNPESVSATNKRTQAKRVANGKFREYQVARRNTKAGYLDRFLERARSENPATDLTREYLGALFGESCAVSGVPFRMDRTGSTSFTNPYAPSIDRIDSSLPYQTGNIQIVLTAINFGKNAMTMDDFTQVWRDISQSWDALTRT